MEPEAKYALVGIAVLILAALLVTTVVWLLGNGQGSNSRQVKIYFERQSLEGLERRSYVTMRGVRVGSVTDLRFSLRRPGAIEVIVTVDPVTPLRESTRATVERNQLTGFAVVRLANTTEDSPALARAPPGEPYPVIAEGEPSMGEVSDTLTQLARSAEDTMQRLNAALSPENRAAFAQALRDLHKLAARYDALGTEATASVRDASDAVRKMSADVDRLSQRADALLRNSDEELRATAQSLRSAADSIGGAAARVRDPQQTIFGPSAGSLGPGEGAR